MKKRQKARKRNPIAQNIAFIVILLIVIGGALYLSTSSPPQATVPSQPKRVLDPMQFSGEVKLAYQVARDIPQVLQQLKCYCGCDNPAHSPYHRNLYECFTDTHGANCQVCVDEALLASNMYARGASVYEIRAAIDEKFG